MSLEDDVMDAYNVYNDIRLLMDRGFSPIGYPPLNPSDAEGSGMKAVTEYNRAIRLIYKGPYDSVLYARPCHDDVEIVFGGRRYAIPRGYLNGNDGMDGRIVAWMHDNGLLREGE